MADNMVRILSDSTEVDQMGKAGREHVREYYSDDRYISEINKLVTEVLE